MKARILGFFILAAALLSFAPDALAQPEPERVARRCVREIASITHRAGHTIVGITRETVAEIRRLLEQGDVEGAEEAARRGATRAARVNHAASGQIRMVAQHCVQILQRLGAPDELIRIVLRAAHEGTTTVNRIFENCLRAIQRALEG